jgi:hypothetical protein
MKALAQAEVELENADPFVETLKTDPYVTQNGTKIIVQDLMRLALEDGMCIGTRLDRFVLHIN